MPGFEGDGEGDGGGAGDGEGEIAMVDAGDEMVGSVGPLTGGCTGAGADVAVGEGAAVVGPEPGLVVTVGIGLFEMRGVLTFVVTGAVLVVPVPRLVVTGDRLVVLGVAAQTRRPAFKVHVNVADFALAFVQDCPDFTVAADAGRPSVAAATRIVRAAKQKARDNFDRNTWSSGSVVVRIVGPTPNGCHRSHRKKFAVFESPGLPSGDHILGTSVTVNSSRGASRTSN